MHDYTQLRLPTMKGDGQFIKHVGGNFVSELIEVVPSLLV